MIYVISDLHGYPFVKFLELLNKANFSSDDYLFILGDVIDRGMYGTEYLKWLLYQENVELLLGNHEAMLLSCSFLFEEVNEENLRNLTPESLELLANWKDNGAKWTLEGFYTMEQDDRISIIEYLREAPLYEIVSVKNQDFLLTHSGLKNFESKRNYQNIQQMIFYGIDRNSVTDITMILKLFLGTLLPLCMVKSIAERL